jgi:hypothetical protein
MALLCTPRTPIFCISKCADKILDTTSWTGVHSLAEVVPTMDYTDNTKSKNMKT